MVADTAGWGSRFFPEIRIYFRSSAPTSISPRLQAALLSVAVAGSVIFAYLGLDRIGNEHLIAKKEAAAALALAAKSDLEHRVAGLRQTLAALTRHRDAAQAQAAAMVTEVKGLRDRLAATAAAAQSLDQTKQALQREKAQSADLTAQLAKIQADRAAEEAQFARYKADLEQTAQQLAQLGAAAGKAPIRRARVRLQLGEIWRKLSQIQFPLPQPGGPGAAAEAEIAAAASPPGPGRGAAGASDFAGTEVDAFERALRSAGVDVARILSKLGAPQAEGGPFVPPAEAAIAAAGAVSPDKLAAVEALAKTLPIAAPLTHYQIGSPFGPRVDPFNGRSAFHTGIDMDAPYSSPVYATAPGSVIYAGWLGDYGKAVEIDHGFGIVTLYAHLSRYFVSVGQNLPAQAEIGLVGTTGRSTGPHVHYEVRVDGQPQDPEKFLGLARLVPAAASGRLNPAVGGPAESSR